MFNWLKRLFDKIETPAVVASENHAVFVEDFSSRDRSTKKTEVTELPKEDDVLETMSKPELLAEAKKRGIKANSSLKKEEILSRIKNGA